MKAGWFIFVIDRKGLSLPCGLFYYRICYNRPMTITYHSIYAFEKVKKREKYVSMVLRNQRELRRENL